LKIVIV
jgi:hypothetical protein